MTAHARGLPAAAAAGGAIAARGGPRRLFVPAARLVRVAYAAVLIAVALLPWYGDVSIWVGLGIALSVFVVGHGASAAYETPWLPGAITFGACVQWVLAPWGIYLLQGSLPVPRMAVPAADYFLFAVPSTLALIVGIYLPLWRVGKIAPHGQSPRGVAASPRLLQACRAMVVTGVVVRIVIAPFAPSSLRYAASLVGMLAMVGALGLLIGGERRWPWWTLLAFAPIAVRNAADLQFLEGLLYAICIGCVIIYRLRPRPVTLALISVPAVLLFLALNAFKISVRAELRKQDLTASARASATSSNVLGLARQPSTLLSPTTLALNLARLNEGWVTSRALAWTPAAEPFARGETLITGVRAALLPRVLAPYKYVVGGDDIIPRFTGIALISSTSMGLSIPGEMYANFGLVGAWIGTFVYGLALGYLYRKFVRRSRLSPLWWAWVPFIFFSPLSAEQGFAENVNQMAKSLLVMWGVVKVVPAWRAVRRRAPRREPIGAVGSPAVDGRTEGALGAAS